MREVGGYPIDLVVTVFGGFTQKRSSLRAGMPILHRQVERMLCHACNARAQFFPWHVDVVDAAESAWNFRRPGAQQVHAIAAFSYGCTTATHYARHLQLLGGCNVAELWLCDPVVRWKPLPGVAAGLGVGTLYVPTIVKHVVRMRQRNPRWQLGRSGGVFQPAGHDVVCESLDTEMDDWITRKSGHSWIDKDPQFHRGFVEIVRRSARRHAQSGRES